MGDDIQLTDGPVRTSDHRLTPSQAVAAVRELFDARGDEFFGEEIDQRRHALQTATFALGESKSDDALVAAALLHDIGHLVHDLDSAADDSPATADDHHEAIGARWIAPRFGPRVARYVALHVLAKRYQCTVDPDYLGGLSACSHQSYLAQGGPLDVDAVARFASMPEAGAVLSLRRCDERGKDPAGVTEPLEAFLPLLERVAESSSRVR